MKVVGLMSGTSGDGVDAALVEIGPRKAGLRIKMMSFYPLPYPRSLRQRILSASVSGTVSELCHLNVLLGEWFANAALGAIRAAKLHPKDIDLIGSHGQTVHHLPYGIKDAGVGAIRSTFQIAEPAVIAERTGVTTVADFRPRDMAAGGQGAPLTPGVHALLFRHPRRARLIVNLGGISNVTYLPRGSGFDGLMAFDTGPANMVLDGLMARITNGRMSMDREGRAAGAGASRPGRNNSAYISAASADPPFRSLSLVSREAQDRKSVSVSDIFVCEIRDTLHEKQAVKRSSSKPA
ncbi:MAG: hypothetical protein HP493_01985 [Nitrospira sp.]|nr:hypothetical protein [Nitrospira sp.]